MKNLQKGHLLKAKIDWRCVRLHIKKNDIVKFIRYNTVYPDRIAVHVKDTEFDYCDSKAVWNIQMFTSIIKRKQKLKLP